MMRRFLIFSFIACLSASCTTQPHNSNTASVPPGPSPSPSVSPVQVTESSVPITLPLLDALLTDEKFVAGLRDNLKLSDAQIDSLKRVSNSEIARLRESNAEELDGNATEARTRASEQLNEILGVEKARALTSYAHDYWSKGDTSEVPGDKGPEMLKGPNAVPTDTRVVVNIPAFRMDLFQDGSLIKSYQIGIGYPEFPLPQGLRKAQSVIFNPTWTPPDSPWVAEMKNVTPGETVAAGDKANPLGPIKIPIGLPSLIHGGKSPAKIGKFASHGCVGLTNSQVKDFALLLGQVSKTDLSENTVASYLQEKDRTQTVKLNEIVPVELRYETIVLEDGKLYIYRDVYAQDTNTEENVKRVLEAHGARFEDLSEQQRTEVLNALTKKPARNEKAVVIDLSAVAQKGYPAPVNLDNGSGKKAPEKTDRTDRKRRTS